MFDNYLVRKQVVLDYKILILNSGHIGFSQRGQPMILVKKWKFYLCMFNKWFFLATNHLACVNFCPQSVSQSAMQSVSQSASQSVSQPVSQPVSRQSISQPVDQSVNQPVSHSASRLVSQSTSQLVSQSVSKSASQ